MSRNFDFDHDVIAVVGCSGQGKSTLQRMLLRDYAARYKFIYDHKAQFSALLPAFSCRTWAHCEKALEQTGSVCFDPRGIFGGDLEGGFEAFSRWVFDKVKRLRGRKLFVWDECGDLVPNNWSLYKNHPVRAFANTGREWEINCLTAAQAPTDIPLKFRNQVNSWCVFKLGDEGCVDPLKQHGFNWPEVSALQKGQFIYYSKKTGEKFHDRTTPER